jgi:hypothetical protein
VFGILIGSVMRSVGAVNGVMLTVLFPITFLANTFAPTEPMQHWLRVIADGIAQKTAPSFTRYLREDASRFR